MDKIFQNPYLEQTVYKLLKPRSTHDRELWLFVLNFSSVCKYNRAIMQKKFESVVLQTYWKDDYFKFKNTSIEEIYLVSELYPRMATLFGCTLILLDCRYAHSNFAKMTEFDSYFAHSKYKDAVTATGVLQRSEWDINAEILILLLEKDLVQKRKAKKLVKKIQTITPRQCKLLSELWNQRFPRRFRKAESFKIQDFRSTKYNNPKYRM